MVEATITRKAVVASPKIIIVSEPHTQKLHPTVGNSSDYNKALNSFGSFNQKIHCELCVPTAVWYGYTPSKLYFKIPYPDVSSAL